MFVNCRDAAEGGPSAIRPPVLVMDDRQENIALIAAILSGIDAEIFFATSGFEALELLDGHEFALALFDVCMPEMDGFEVALQMRSRGGTAPIVFVTAQDRNECASMRAYAIGGADFLYKPLEPAVLRAKVQVFLDLYRLRHADARRVRELEALHESLVLQQAQARAIASDLALQKEQLEHRNRELTLRNSQLDSFTHVISHDLRQPLGSILDYLEMIEHASGDHLDAGTVRWIKACLRLGENMQVLIDEVLDYSRLGAKPPAMSSVDTNTVLTSVLDGLHAAVQESGALIGSDRLATVLGSPALLTSLFQNLIGNAIKYHGADPPKIHISSAWCDVDLKWRFRITDNGRGIRDGDCERIFEMFGRGGDVNGIPGTGIGLAACKRIVEAHGGRIWAESISNQGSEFYFVLPDAGPGAANLPGLEK